MIHDKMVAMKKAYFPYNIILWIFKKTMCSADSKVAMIDPIFLNILTIGNNNLISASLYKHEQAHIEQVKKIRQNKIYF